MRHKARFVALDNTDLPEPGRAKKRSIQVVCIGDPGWYGQIFPSGDRNNSAPFSHGEHGLNNGSIQIASLKDAAVLVETL
tara:strand:- start:71 stop:310 length:240 start_codon:yes stop_codon:yes gene_type:complete